ncbi:MAG: DNA polymerase III subunit delta [Chloroflexi bacterium]|nr:DNA polymerase III subunit delta [Chloroflexota bacterium]
MLYIFWGPDDFSLRQSLVELKKNLGDPAALLISTSELDGRQLAPNDLRTCCETMPFLSPCRLVVVEGLLERFEPPANTGKKPPKKASLPDHKPFADCIAALPAFTALVLTDSSVSNSNPLFRELAVKADVRAFPRPRGARLAQWIASRVKERGGRIAPGAVELLAGFAGDSLWVLAGEIDKLAVYAGSRTIDENDVRNLVSATVEANIFALVDAALENRVSQAENMLEDLAMRGVAAPRVLAMLGRQLGLMVRARDLLGQRTPPREIQSRLGLSADFVFNKTVEQAQRYTWTGLKRAYRKLLETDIIIKTGAMDSQTALNLLVVEIARSPAPLS